MLLSTASGPFPASSTAQAQAPRAAGLSFVATRWIGALLYGVAPTDPFTFAAMAIILLATSALAGYITARRAASIDPVDARRVE